MNVHDFEDVHDFLILKMFYKPLVSIIKVRCFVSRIFIFDFHEFFDFHDFM